MSIEVAITAIRCRWRMRVARVGSSVNILPTTRMVLRRFQIKRREWTPANASGLQTRRNDMRTAVLAISRDFHAARVSEGAIRLPDRGADHTLQVNSAK